MMLQNVTSVWTGLSLRRRLVVAGATLAMFLAVLALARMAGGPQMVLLYAGLDGRAAGEVIAALDQRAVAYEVRGDSILVDINARDALRMSLAGEGLPSAGSQGYELLDQLTGFGTTSQMFDAAYWRAKEGELARTILAVPEIRAARVHISQGPSDTFRRDQTPTASVTVTTASGNLSESQARALKHLVASAVAGLRPEDVHVIDTVGGLIAANDAPDAATGTAASGRAAEIRHNVERLLEARVGPGKAVVEVAVDLVTDRETLTERKIDPQGRVAISSETEEHSQQATEPGGAVTVASNLPEGDAGPGANGKSSTSETRERVNYEVSETQRELTRGPGGIRRLTVAVLVDGQMVTAADGTQSRQPRSDEELAALRELVASAVGLDETRGDVLTLKSLDFTQPTVQGTEATTRLIPPLGPIDVMAAIQIAALALVALILGLFVLRPLLASGRAAAQLPAPEGRLALPGAATAPEALTGEIQDGFSLPDLPMVDFAANAPGEEAAEDPATRLRRLIAERQTETIEILRGWLEPEEERA
ncbi:flagellar basal-body MS-ring/collar protein FliF [Fuscovulum blasticum]|uniref:flagellar basal-body MS-ring/collar protein FliF n=1 Tax=Fuscovulum blasticum TaxID=1075 RepID=UPI000D3E1E2D|nr:flagellar basal-body MS-ring/collar protein FliF [Fuscovulum blasticum]AWD21989.1 flagellar M-ring protein FliF [Fuscovulum blasticum]